LIATRAYKGKSDGDGPAAVNKNTAGKSKLWEVNVEGGKGGKLWSVLGKGNAWHNKGGFSVRKERVESFKNG